VNSCAVADVFDVRPASPGYAISLRDAKQHLSLSLTDTSIDAELRGWVESATRVAESKVGPVAKVTHTDVVDGGAQVTLSRYPVLSLTSTSARYTTDTADVVGELDFDPTTGVVWRRDGRPVACQRVTYRAGRSVVPGNITDAVKIIVKHMWETQRGGSAAPGRVLGTEEVTFMPQFGFAVPNRALELLAADMQVPVA